MLREPSATPDTGLYAALKRELTRSDAGIAALLGAALLGPALADPRLRTCTIAGALAALLAGFAWTRAWRSRIGGSNGDVLGAAVELREAVVLLAFAGPLAA